MSTLVELLDHSFITHSIHFIINSPLLIAQYSVNYDSSIKKFQLKLQGMSVEFLVTVIKHLSIFNSLISYFECTVQTFANLKTFSSLLVERRERE